MITVTPITHFLILVLPFLLLLFSVQILPRLHYRWILSLDCFVTEMLSEGIRSCETTIDDFMRTEVKDVGLRNLGEVGIWVTRLHKGIGLHTD